MHRTFSFLFGLLALSMVACGGDDGDTDPTIPAGEGGSSGQAGAAGQGAGQGGQGVSGASGQGGSSAGKGGAGASAGAAGGGGSAGSGAGAAGASGSGAGGGASGVGGASGEGGAGSGGEAGVGGAAGSAAGGQSAGGQSAGGAGGEAGGAGEAGAGGAEVCPSGVVCGAGECCAAGDECVFGACLPSCGSGVRCGPAQTCCEAGDVCVADLCTSPTTGCVDYSDCEENEFCEPTLGKCLPQPGEPACIFKPPVGAFEAELEWSWTGSTIQPTHNQVINTPLVFDLDKDGTPDVIIVTSNSYDAGGIAYLRALDGKTGQEKWGANAGVYTAAGRVQPRSTPAVGDIDGDGSVDIVAFKEGGGLIAFEQDGSVKWTSTNANGTDFNAGFSSGTVTLADLEGDGKPEIIAAGVVLENDGKVRFNQGVLVGSNNNSYGASSIVADVDGDGKQEILSGRRAFRSDGTVLWDNGLSDGYPAIADLDLDGKPELVAITNDVVRVHDAVTGAQLASLAMPGNGAGGPPTIAQFDGLGGPDFASANGTAYSVYTYDAATQTISVLWSKTTQDQSSNRTGSTVFDFEGDGKAEVVYNDECYMRVYAGADGAVLLQIANSSATIHEYPVVADVDGDNNTEIIVGANDLTHKNSNICPYPAAQSRHGVFVYGDKNDSWVRTRRLWNQHAYHVTNINNDGTIPAPEVASWGPKGFNNYRQSTQGKASFNAVDMQVSLAALVDQCPATIGLQATIKNGGSLGVPAGVVVSFYEGTPPNGVLLGSKATTQPLLPGGSESVILEAPGKFGDASYYVVVDADGSGIGSVNECIEDNNSAVVAGDLCGKP